jgi:carboxylate-amine ligase
VKAIAALVQCLVHSISNEIDQGTFQSEFHPMMVQQNKWRATRYGGDAKLVSTRDFQPRSVQAVINGVVDELLPIAESLNCTNELQAARSLPENTGALQQLRIFEATKSRREVVRQMLPE